MFGVPIPPELHNEVIEKGAARGVVVERSKVHPNVYFETPPAPPNNPVAVAAEHASVFAAETATEDANVARAQAEADEAERVYREALSSANAYVDDRHLVDLVSTRTVKQDRLALALKAQTDGRQRRAQLNADGIPEAFDKAKEAASVEAFIKACAPALRKAEQAGKLLGEARQLVTAVVHAHAPLEREAMRLAQLLGIRGHRSANGADMGDAVRLVAAAIAKGFKASGANTIELTRWLGS
jgi:hypothetical protein